MDNRIIRVALDRIRIYILKVGELDKELETCHIMNMNSFIEDANGMEKIHECQNNANEQI